MLLIYLNDEFLFSRFIINPKNEIASLFKSLILFALYDDDDDDDDDTKKKNIKIST